MGLAAPITSLMARIATVQVETPDQETTDLFCRVWNNQIELLAAGQLEAMPIPAAFVEAITTEPAHGSIGQGVTGFDIRFRIHLLHTHYNTEGSYEQNLEVFDLRDKIVRVLNRFRPDMCSHLGKVAESQDYNHTNVYHYIIEYTCHCIDFVGSDQDTLTGDFTESDPPITLITNINAQYIVSSIAFAVPACASEVTALRATYTFNNLNAFKNGSTIQVSNVITGGGAVTITKGSGAAGLGYSFDGVDLITITDIDAFLSFQLNFAIENTLCKVAVELITRVIAVTNTNLPYLFDADMQQIGTSTYTPSS